MIKWKGELHLQSNDLAPLLQKYIWFSNACGEIKHRPKNNNNKYMRKSNVPVDQTLRHKVMIHYAQIYRSLFLCLQDQEKSLNVVKAWLDSDS